VRSQVGAAPTAAPRRPRRPVRPRRRPPPVDPWSDEALLAAASTFIDDDVARRAALEASLTNHGNTYSQQRLAAYGLGTRGWDALPVWNPRSRPVGPAELAALADGTDDALVAATAPLWDGVRPTTMAGWVELGRKVFTAYPLRDDEYIGHALGRPEVMAAHGLQRLPTGEVPGPVLFRDVDGTTAVGITCALCHTNVEADALVVGRARRSLDYGQLRLAYDAALGLTETAAMETRLRGWGPGRADVTEDDDEDPVAIPDLWGLRHVEALTQAGTITHHSPMALAIRQETQLLHASHQRVRPPRELAWALAMYVYSLSPPAAPPTTAEAAPQLARGAATFEAACARCHDGAARGGTLMPASKVGTNAALATGRGRGTGQYRVGLLLGVDAGAPYLHDGTVASLEELLAPRRLAADYTLGARGPGPVPGHRYGVDLADADRRDLIAFLRTL
jgi:hypothetical protein